MSSKSSRLQIDCDKLKAVVITTVHPSNDVRIFERQIKSLATLNYLTLTFAAPGVAPTRANFKFISTPIPNKNRFLRMIQSQFTSSFVYLRTRPNIWHFHDPELILVSLFIAKYTKTKVIWDSHEDYRSQFADLNGGKAWVPKLFRGAFATLITKMLRSVDKHVFGVLGATQQICSLYMNANVVYVGNEAKTLEFKSASPSFQNRQVLFVGSLSNETCFEEIVTAFKEIPNLNLAVAGRPNPEALSWAKSHLGNKLVILGWLDRAGLVKAISDSVLGLVTYADSTVMHSNSPTKLFEFSAAGLPVIASPTVANRNFLELGQNGMLAMSFSSSDFKNAILEALEDEIIWSEWSRNGIIWASENGDWAESELRLFNLYDLARKSVLNSG